MAIDDSEFPRVFRGYEPEVVDRALLRLRREILNAKTEVDRLTIAVSELTEENATLKLENSQVGKPTFAGLGHALESTLRSAQEQADALLSRAAADAFNSKNATERERATILEAATSSAALLTTQAQERAEETIARAQARADEIVSAAEAKAGLILDEAMRDAADARRDSTTEITRDRSNAVREITALKTEAAREIAELKLILTNTAKGNKVVNVSDEVLEVLRVSADAAAHRDEAEREYLAKHQEAVHNTEQYLEVSQTELSALKVHLAVVEQAAKELTEKAEAQAAKLYDAVDQRALKILEEANEQASNILTAAQRAAAETTRQAEASAQQRLREANAERELLEQQMETLKDVVLKADTSKPTRTARTTRTSRAKASQ
jgi:cell division septum initiation protein DivIVA